MNLSTTRVGLFLRETRHVIATLRVLVLCGLAMLGVGSPPENPHLYWFLTLIYGVTIFGYLWAKNRDYNVQRVKWVVFLFDVGIVSALILARGDQPSEFLTAYFGLVLMAAIADGLGNAFTNSILVSTAYAVITRWGQPPDTLLTFPVVSQFVFFFIIAVFMGHLATEARAQEADGREAKAKLQRTSNQLRRSTEQLKATRDALRANDRLATLGMMSAGIAHELKNPLASILGSLEPAGDILVDLERATAHVPEVNGDLDELKGIVADCRIAGDQLIRMSQDLMSVAKGASGEIDAVAPAEALHRAVSMLRNRAKNGLAIETEIVTDLRVLADRGRLLQVLLNLGGNALDALEGVGEGVLRFRHAAPDHDRVAFVVQDTGPGMPDEVLRHAFDPFFTTKSPGKGTGLGLHVVNEIVRAQRGTIECQSRPGEGTTFTVILPGTTETDHGHRDQDPADRRRRGDDSPGAAAHAASGAVRAPARV